MLQTNTHTDIANLQYPVIFASGFKTDLTLKFVVKTIIYLSVNYYFLLLITKLS